MDHPQVLYKFKECAGQSWMPSNGTEGMMFTDEFCDQCIHEKFQHTQKDGDLQCKILDNSFIHWYTDQWAKEVPQWQYNKDGWPHCTEWVKWDWGSDDDFNDPPDELKPLPFYPGQLDLFPLYIGAEFQDQENLILIENG